MMLSTILVHKSFITLIESFIYSTPCRDFTNELGGKMFKPFIKLIVTISLFFTSTFSLAQIALEEMVVTSQKREQNLLDVPSALQAFSGSMLEGAGVRTLMI